MLPSPRPFNCSPLTSFPYVSFLFPFFFEDLAHDLVLSSHGLGFPPLSSLSQFYTLYFSHFLLHSSSQITYTMKFFASIATAFLLLSALTTADTIESCSESQDLFQITSVSATEAVAGAGVTVTLTGKVTAVITESAEIVFTASVGIISVKQNFNMCEVIASKAKCPITVGEKTIKLQFKIPASAPELSGVAIKGVAMQGSSRVFCVTGTVDVAAAKQ
ncbi:hypothetical protein KVV02_006413 [Mortierella alpina]|uniref:Phosphatidylglycerol/phosphatidylinositol transfer protein n=1 Tax=Mortierella alpina TaxID=64518 RepID=A0A9P8IF98_MORAP|nr:hypothetical protein KVV02_006413 [Mortierella alpina]